MLTVDEARRLDALTLQASGATPLAAAAGLRRTRERGAGIEFLDYRHYQPGDDPRSIDWTVEARLDQLVVRVSRAEGHIRLHLLLDTSASMSIGTPTKLHCAARAAAALAYVAIERRDAAGLATFDDTVRTRLPPIAGRPQLFRVLDSLGRARPARRSSLDRSLTAYGSSVRGPGLAVVLSDFLDAGDGLEGLTYLAYRGLTPVVIQVLAPEERRPRLEGDVELEDVENTQAAPLVVDDTMVAAYLERLAALTGRLRQHCLTRGLPYVQLDADASFDDTVRACRQAGLLGAFG